MWPSPDDRLQDIAAKNQDRQAYALMLFRAAVAEGGRL